MKAWTRRIIAFVLVAALLLSLQELVMPKYASSLYEGSFTREYYNEKREHQVLMVGDCELYENFDPITLWNNYGITSYIRGNAQQQAWQSYYLLREALKKETPDVVVFSVLSLEFDEPQKEEYNRLMLDRMKWSTDKLGAIRASMMEEEHFLDYVFPLLRYHSRITQLTDEDFDYYGKKVDHTVAGYYMRIDTAPYVVGTWGEENNVGSYTAAARQEADAGDASAEVDEEDEGWSPEADDEDEGWSAEADDEDEGWSAEADDEGEGWSAEADGEDEGWSAEADDEDEGWSAEADDEDEGWSAEADDEDEGWSAEADEEDEGWSAEADEEDEGWSAEADDEDDVDVPEETADAGEEETPQSFVEAANASDVEPLGENAMFYLDRIRELCEEKGIKLLLVKAPSVSPVWYDVWERQITDYADQYGIDYINYLDLVDEIGINFAEDTYDEGLHMNYSGAIKCADYLGDYLVKHYGLKDMRSDQELSEIWKGKADFQQELIKKQQTELEEYGMIVSK